MHVIDACSELNKKIGEDISLISFDSNILSFLAPNITVVSQAAKETNENFIKRAPRTVIEKEKSNFDKLTREMKKINHNLNMLS